ncbi:hypothetical protein JCM8097_005539 [Rhodosporidiobolus ruineniae]
MAPQVGNKFSSIDAFVLSCHRAALAGKYEIKVFSSTYNRCTVSCRLTSTSTKKVIDGRHGALCKFGYTLKKLKGMSSFKVTESCTVHSCDAAVRKARASKAVAWSEKKIAELKDDEQVEEEDEDETEDDDSDGSPGGDGDSPDGVAGGAKTKMAAGKVSSGKSMKESDPPRSTSRRPRSTTQSSDEHESDVQVVLAPLSLVSLAFSDAGLVDFGARDSVAPPSKRVKTSPQLTSPTKSSSAAVHKPKTVKHKFELVAPLRASASRKNSLPADKKQEQPPVPPVTASPPVPPSPSLHGEPRLPTAQAPKLNVEPVQAESDVLVLPETDEEEEADVDANQADEGAKEAKHEEDEKPQLEYFAEYQLDTLAAIMDRLAAADKLNIQPDSPAKWEMEAFKGTLRRMAKGKGKAVEW